MEKLEVKPATSSFSFGAVAVRPTSSFSSQVAAVREADFSILGEMIPSQSKSLLQSKSPRGQKHENTPKIFEGNCQDNGNTSFPENIAAMCLIMAFFFDAWPAVLDTPWRQVAWTEENKETLMESVRSYKPVSESVSEARVLLLGPVGAGKSSFISSVQSVFSGRVVNRAMVGSSSSTSFTKKLQSFRIRGGGEGAEQATALVLCDMMGVGEGETTGLTLHDTLAVIKGHAPEGHKFSPEQPVRSETLGYVKKPSLKDKVHCVVFVVDASKISSYSKGMSTTFHQLREHISDLGVHQVALLTHVDQVCPETARDITQVYKSRAVQQTMVKAGALLGMSTSYIVPVKNYCSELELNEHGGTLLLSAVDHILQYVDLYFQDGAAETKGAL